jgi:predicted NUDIX family NTP pyrophosphohydrolase
VPKKSAGLLLFRGSANTLEVFLVHPGGPFWAKKDDGAWSIPKGKFSEDEDALSAAIREFEEETGSPITGDFLPLDPAKQQGGKVVYAWAVAGDLDPSSVRSNMFEMEWPPGSGQRREFPEVDRAGWFDLPTARRKILSGQAPLLDQLRQALEQIR